jgi:hypothetical protein
MRGGGSRTRLEGGLCKGDSRKTGRQFSFIVRRGLSQISAISKIVDIAIRKF